MLVNRPKEALFPNELWARLVGQLSDFMAFVTIAIGFGGSIAVGVFQVSNGIDVMLGGEKTAGWFNRRNQKKHHNRGAAIRLRLYFVLRLFLTRP